MRIAAFFLATLLSTSACRAADGALDGTFGNLLPGISKVYFNIGGNTRDAANAVLVQSDGKLVLVGWANTSIGTNFALTRLQPNGAIDSSFGTSGRVNYSPGPAVVIAQAAALQADGKILVAGYTEVVIKNFLICRFQSSGAIDAGFGSSGCTTISFLRGGDDVAKAIALQSDGKIVVAGYSTPGGPGNTNFALVRLNSDGTPDMSFGFGGTGRQLVTRFETLAGVPTVDSANAVVIRSDGKIVAAGSTRALTSSNSDFAVAQFDSYGQLDGTFGNLGVRTIAFDIGGGLSDEVHAAAVQPDGKLVLAGSASYALGDTDYAIVRLDASGSLDPSFAASGKITVPFDLGGAGIDWPVAIALQSDGRILIAGHSYNSAGNAGMDISVCRLLRSGYTDPTFGPSGNGKTSFGLNLAQPYNETAGGVALQGGRPVITGMVVATIDGGDFFAARLSNGLIYTNGFER